VIVHPLPECGSESLERSNAAAEIKLAVTLFR
jgi:hypothetical protein